MTSFSQENTEYVANWDSADNNTLPQNSIKSIVKDNNGFIWISTENGFVRYDGKNYFVFNVHRFKGLKSDRMLYFQGSVLNDSIYLSNDKQDFFLIHNSDPKIVKNKNVPRGYIYDYLNFPNTKSYLKILYFDKGYYEIKKNVVSGYDKNKNILWTIGYPAANSTFFVFENNLYAFDNEGSCFWFDNDQIIKTKIENLVNEKAELILNLSAQQIFVRQKNNLHLLVSKNGNLSLQTVFRDFDLSNDNIVSAFFDKQNDILYLGSSTKGLLTIKKKSFKTLKGSIHDGSYYAHTAYVDDAVLTASGEIFTTSGKIKKMNWSQANDNYSILIDSKDNIWTKFNHIVYCYLKESQHTTFKRWEFGNRVTQIFESNDHNIYVGTSSESTLHSGQLFKLTETDSYFRPFMSLKFHPAFMSQDNSGICWIGSSIGFHKIDLNKKEATDIKSFENMQVRNLLVEGDKIWIATYGQGIFLYDSKTKKTIRFPLDNNKFLATSHCFVKDAKGFFWIPTNKGLFQVLRKDLLRFSLGETDAVYYHYYDRNDGFITNEFNGGCQPCGVFLKNNFIFLPSLQGNVFFDSNKIKPLIPRNKVFFKEVEIGDKMFVQKGDTLTLEPDFGRVRFFIRSPYFGHLNNQNIEVKLEGPITQNWIKLNEDNIAFTSMPPGVYTITARKLTGFDSKYVYAKKVMIIEKKFWQTTFFKLLLSSIAIALGYFILRLRVNYLKRRNIVLEKKVEERTVELNETIKVVEKTKNKLSIEIENHKKLIGSITHDIKSPLRFLALTGKLTYKNIQGKSGKEIRDDEDLHEAVKSMYTSSFQLYNFVDNLLEYTKISSNDYTTEPYFLHYVIAEKIKMFSNIADSKKILLQNAVDENLILYSHQILLSIILHNLLDNAIKNTSSGHILFAVDAKDDKICIKISDTGKGMSNEMVAFYNALLAQQTEKPKMTRIGMGFQMISELLTLMDATMEIKSHLGLGTEIQIRFENHKS